MTKRITFQITVVFLMISFISWGHPFCISSADIAQKVRVSGGAGQISSNGCLEVLSQPWDKTAFFQEKLDYDVSTIQQIEACFMSKVPGYIGFASMAVQEDGARKGFGAPIQSVMPDGEYHTYIFDVSHNQMHTGKMSNWEVRFTGYSGAVGLKSIKARSIVNRIADAENLLPGKQSPVAQLMPRSRCILKWEGPEPATTTLRFFDRDMQELPQTSVVLKPRDKQVEFTTPEMLIYSMVEMANGGVGYPVLQEIAHVPRHARVGRWRGQWIWCQKEDGPFNARVWFKKEITLDENASYAAVAMQADDAAALYVNGTFVGRTTHWQIPGFFNVTKSLKNGKNEIAICVYNGDLNAGLSADIYVKTPSKEIFADTDRSWTCEAKSNSEAHIPKVIGQPVFELGLPDETEPWKKQIGFRHAGPCGILEIIESRPGRIKAKVLELPKASISRVHFKLQREGCADYEMYINLAPASNEWKKGGIVELSYKVPYVEKGRARLFLADDYLASMQPETPVLEWSVAATAAPPLLQARFVNAPRTMIKLGDKLYSPTFWHALGSTRGGRLEELQIAAEQGLKNYRVAVDFHKFWRGPNEYNFDDLDAIMTEVLTVCPDAVFNIQIYAHMPEWWLNMNPDEMAAKAHGAPLRRDREYQTLTSRKWVEDSREPIRALVEYVKTRRYADRIWGATVCENGNGEWFWNNQDARNNRAWGGYGVADTVNFRKYLQEKYGTAEALAKAWNMPGMTFEKAELPMPEAAGKAGCGELYISPKEQNVMDWIDYRSVALGQAICGFGKIIKELTDGKWIFGVYYGYFTELLGNSGGRPIQLSGHTAFLEVAKSPYVDFVHGPSRYTFRRVGMPDGIMQPWSTYQLRGKTVYVEGDVRLGYGMAIDYPYTKNYIGQSDSGLRSIGQLYRMFGMALATGSTFYWFDIEHGAFYEKAMAAAINEIERVKAELPPLKNTIPVEVAIVGDRDSANYTRNATETGIYTHSIDGLFKRFNELAVPFHSMVVSDLLDKEAAAPAHKFYIMLPTLVLSAEQRKALMERFSREKATVLWLYAAAPSYLGKGPDQKFNADFLGIKTKMSTETEQPAMTTVPDFGSIRCENPTVSSPWFIPTGGFDKVIGSDDAGRPLFVLKKIDGATHYFTTLMTLPTELYVPLLEKASVWRYRTELHDPCWIGNDVVFIHAVTEGKKSFNLPKGTRLRAIIGPFKGTLAEKQSFDTTPGMTYGFVLEQ